MIDLAAERLSQIAGAVGAGVAVGGPIILWQRILKPWKPKGHFEYAARWAAWPVVIFTYAFGRPVAYLVAGLPASEPLSEAAIAFAGGSVIFSPIAFAAGLAYGGVMKEFKSKPKNDGTDPGDVA